MKLSTQRKFDLKIGDQQRQIANLQKKLKDARRETEKARAALAPTRDSLNRLTATYSKMLRKEKRQSHGG